MGWSCCNLGEGDEGSCGEELMCRSCGLLNFYRKPKEASVRDPQVLRKPIRLCILTTDSCWGGTEKMIYTLISGMPKEQYVISLITLMGDGTLVEKLRPFCDTVINFNAKSKFDIRLVFKLIRHLREKKYDVLHTFLFHSNILGRLIGKYVGIPMIISSQRSVDVWRRTWHVLMDRWTSSFCDAIISNSRAGKDRLASIEKIPSDKLFVVRNGIQLSEIPSKKDKLGEETVKVVGMVGNFRGMKGHDIFIEAARLLIKEGGNYRFIIVGDGKERKKYEDRVREDGLEGNIQFLGRVRDVYPVLNIMDIFVLPSLWEGFPVSILEAMAMNVPVIVTNVGGVPEIVQHAETGIVIPSNNPVALKEAILRLDEDPVATRKMTEKAKDNVFKNFNSEKMIRETVLIYEKIFKGKGYRLE